MKRFSEGLKIEWLAVKTTFTYFDEWMDGSAVLARPDFTKQTTSSIFSALSKGNSIFFIWNWKDDEIVTKNSKIRPNFRSYVMLRQSVVLNKSSKRWKDFHCNWAFLFFPFFCFLNFFLSCLSKKFAKKLSKKLSKKFAKKFALLVPNVLVKKANKT